MKITQDISYVGVNDHQVDLFEGQYVVPNGMAYNSYVIQDEKTVVMDAVEASFAEEWLDKIAQVLGSKSPEYLVIQHMEPDHSSGITAFAARYPKTVLVSSAAAFNMMNNFLGTDFAQRRRIITEGDVLELGRHSLQFVAAPMVHWPEVMVTYDRCDKVLFSADGFGKFGALDVEEDWACEARRYYIGIVGKYGVQVQSLLQKAATLDIQKICPLHGPVLTEKLDYYLNLYNTWSSYGVESEGIVIAYTSVYGHTKEAVELLAKRLTEKGVEKVKMFDLARSDMSEAVEDAFRYGTLVLATTTYNMDIFPFMRTFIEHLTERNFQNRRIALIENGSWAPAAARVMKGLLEKSKNLTYAAQSVRIKSALNEESRGQIEALATELSQKDPAAEQPRSEEGKKDFYPMGEKGEDMVDTKAFFNIGYGLYVITSNDGKRDNGMICNAVNQVASNPCRIAVSINKANYTHDVVQETGKMNVNILTESAPFSTFQKFGFQSGRDKDKFAGETVVRSNNGLAVLCDHADAFLSLKVESYTDMGSHGMFICSVEEARVHESEPTMTYAYYQNNVKPKPGATGKKGYVCKICGYVHEGELPPDFVCPLCKHPASDFEPLP